MEGSVVPNKATLVKSSQVLRSSLNKMLPMMSESYQVFSLEK